MKFLALALVFSLAIFGCAAKKVGDVSHCIADIEAVVSAVPQLVSDINTGNIPQLLKDIATIVPTFEALTVDCKNLVALRAYLDITAPNGSNDLAKCLDDIVKLVPTVEKTIDDISKGDILAIIQDIENLYVEIDKVLTDCSDVLSTIPNGSVPEFVQVGNVSQCVEDILVVVSDAQRIINDLNTQNFSGIIQELPGFIQQVQTTLSDCQNLREVVEYQRSIGNISACVEDAIALIPIIEQTINDINAANFTAIIIDVENLVNGVLKTVSDCQNLRNSQRVTIEDTQTCIADFEELTQDVITAYYAVQAGNINDFVQAVGAAVQVVERLGTDCNIRTRSCANTCRLTKVCNEKCNLGVRCGC